MKLYDVLDFNFCVYKYPSGIKIKFCIVTIVFVDKTEETFIVCSVYTYSYNEILTISNTSRLTCMIRQPWSKQIKTLPKNENNYLYIGMFGFVS